MKKDPNYFRRSLQPGPTYLKVEVCENGVKSWHDPETTQFRMTGCELINNRKAAQGIYEGKTNKLVCAWVRFQSIEILETPVEVGIQVRFNPRVIPHWTLNWDTHCIDGMAFPELITLGASVCLPA